MSAEVDYRLSKADAAAMCSKIEKAYMRGVLGVNFRIADQASEGQAVGRTAPTNQIISANERRSL